MKNIPFFFWASVLLIASSCNNQASTNYKEDISGDLIIFHAGSLSVPFKEVADAFKMHYPEINVLAESAGSRTCARKITDLHRACDIMASADYSVIDNLLIPDFASWNIRFATNEMALAYTPKSRYADEITDRNWFDIFLKDDVIYGRSDPNSDPCGYRSVLTCELAENFYGMEGLSKKLIEKDKNFIRPKEVDLLALLESHAIDYIFIYRSRAQQHHLKYVIRPDSINRKSPKISDYYSKATVTISGKTPGETITKKGEPMVYGITIPRQAAHKKDAEKFVELLLSKNKGMVIMEKNGQPSIVPAFSQSYDNIPELLKPFAKSSQAHFAQ